MGMFNCACERVSKGEIEVEAMILESRRIGTWNGCIESELLLTPCMRPLVFFGPARHGLCRRTFLNVARSAAYASFPPAPFLERIAGGVVA